MTTWTNITDASLEPGKPLRSIDLLALRDNPIAVAAGAAGAPKIKNTAFNTGVLGAEKFQTGTTERDWVLARTSDAGAGAVGTYAFLKTNTPVGFNQNISGFSLTPSNSENDSSGSVSGTWKCMGTVSSNKSTLWLRIA
jgi:hypothetical protein